MNAHAQNIAVLSSRRSGRPIIDRFDWLCILVLLLSFIAVSRMPAAPSKYGDLYFHEEAKSLAHAVRGIGPWDEVSFARAPGPALYYAVPYLFLPRDASDGVYWRAALLWNALWMIVAVLLVRRAAEFLRDDPAGKIATIFTIIIPFGVYYSFGVAAETPAYVATVIFMYGWARWLATPGSKLFSSTGIVAAAGLMGLILCRPNALVVVGIALAAYAGMLLLQRARSNGAGRRFALFAAALGMGTVLLVSFALKHMPGNRGVSAQTSNLDEAFFLSNFQFRTETWDWRFWGKGTRAGSVDYQNYAMAQKQIEREADATGTPVSKLQMDWTVRDAKQYPWTRIKMSFIRLLSLNVWLVNSAKPSAFHLGPFRGKTVYVVFHFLINIVALAPALLSICFLVLNRKEFFEYWPLWGLWVGLLLFHALTYAEPRYMLPALPGLAIMGACFLSDRFKHGRTVAAHFSGSRASANA